MELRTGFLEFRTPRVTTCVTCKFPGRQTDIWRDRRTPTNQPQTARQRKYGVDDREYPETLKSGWKKTPTFCERCNVHILV